VSAAGVIVFGSVAFGLNRYVWSCKWAAHDASGLTLRRGVNVTSCKHSLSWGVEATFVLDSSATAVAGDEARKAGYRRTEDISPTTDTTMYRPYAGKRGWFFSTFLRPGSNGGYTFVVLDMDARTLTVTHHPL
jgi:hypothetical protein